MNSTFRLLIICVFMGLFPYIVQARDATSYRPAAMEVQSSIPTGTVATWPLDAAVPPGWLACNGQGVPSSYPELRALMGSVPNYNNRQFLRGSTSGAGRAVTDSTRSHTHDQPAHTHTFSLGLSSTALAGTANGQKYTDNHTGIDGNGVYAGPELSRPLDITYVTGVSVSGEGVSASVTTGHKGQTAFMDTQNKIAQSSTVTGNILNGNVSGAIHNAGNDTTYMNQDDRGTAGGSETAPQHTLVKFIIKHD